LTLKLTGVNKKYWTLRGSYWCQIYTRGNKTSCKC